MKKVLCGIALALVMVFSVSCGNQKKNVVVEEEAVETVDTLEVAEAPADSLQVAE